MTTIYKGREFKGKLEPKTHKLELLISRGWVTSTKGDELCCQEYAGMAMDNGALDYRISLNEDKDS